MNDFHNVNNNKKETNYEYKKNNDGRLEEGRCGMKGNTKQSRFVWLSDGSTDVNGAYVPVARYEKLERKAKRLKRERDKLKLQVKGIK